MSKTLRWWSPHSVRHCIAKRRSPLVRVISNTTKRKTVMSVRRVRFLSTWEKITTMGRCTTAKRGRKIVRLAREEDKQRFEAQYEANQEIYNRRKSRVEHPFGHIKRNLKTNSFMLRGQQGVRAECSILATCFDLARMMTLV